MRDEILCRFDEDGSLELYDSYATIECETKEDYDHLIEMVELGMSVVRCKECDFICEGNVYPVCTCWGRNTDYEGFCHMGERREENG